jgi:hypothetical protein
VDDTHTFFWLVGLFEGEAYFGMDSSKGSAVIQVEMKDEHVIARLAAMFDLNYQCRDRRSTRPSSSVTYRVKLQGEKALRLMQRIKPYMSPRRARAIQMVEDRMVERAKLLFEARRVPLPRLVELPYTVER